MMKYECGICKKSVKYDSIQCDSCQLCIHRRCTELSKHDFINIGLSNCMWFCANCRSEVFPFASVTDEDIVAFYENITPNLADIYSKCKNITFESFTYTDNDTYFDSDIDPENNFYNRIMTNCDYYLDDQFKCSFQQDGISIINFNARSLNANFDDIVVYMDSLSFEFDVISFTETWLENNDLDDFMLKGYKFYRVSRTNKRGGGVAIYVKESIKHNQVKELSKSIDNVLDFVAVEIELNNAKKINVCTLYRPPNTDIEQFNNEINEILKSFKRKTVYLCGDYNINLLNSESNMNTNAFIDLMFSYGLRPLITKPTRITEFTSTLIDNIFSNECNIDIDGGLLVNDITDHLPIFIVCKYKVDKEKKHQFVNKRDTKDCNVKRFIDSFQNIDWCEVLAQEDVNNAYDLFINKIVKLYDEYCPIKKSEKKSYRNKKTLVN